MDRLTASGILAHVLESAGVRTGTTIDRKDLENMAASLDGQLADILATAKREAEQAAEIERLNARVRKLEDALIACHTDIGHWVQLAEYQRGKMDQDLGWCPTEDGITRSKMVRGQIISTALGKEPRP